MQTSNNVLAPSKSSPYYSNNNNPKKMENNRDMAMFIHKSTGQGENAGYLDALDRSLEENNQNPGGPGLLSNKSNPYSMSAQVLPNP